MKAVLLSAGYATRLYPLTINYPKALLPIKRKPIINYIIDKLKAIKEIDEIIIVTNDRYHKFFIEWRNNYYGDNKNIKIINDLTQSENDRLGAIGDLSFAIKKEKINTDTLVVATDNLFDFNLAGLIKSSRKFPHLSVGVYNVGDLKRATRFGVVKMDKNDLITDFAEKPKTPFSKLVAVGLYFMPRNVLKFIRDYMRERNASDALGHYIEWLIQKDKVKGYLLKGAWFDIGDITAYKKAKLSFEERSFLCKKIVIR